MATPLTWRDVANPALRAPDTSGAADAVTRGIEQLTKSVGQIANAPADRRKAALAAEAQIIGIQQKGSLDQAAMGAQLEKVLKTDRVERDAAEFGAAQSILEAAARDAAIQGKSFDDFLQNETYMKLGQGARALASSHLSDAFTQGTTIRMQQEENARQARQWAAGFSLQQAAAGRAERELRFRIDQANKEEAKAKGPVLSQDPLTNILLGDRAKKVGNMLFEVTGANYESQSIGDLVKAGGFGDISEATESFNALNARRQKAGLPVLPDGVMKSLLAGQAGKNTFPVNWVNEFDQGDFENALEIRAEMFDNGMKEQEVFTDMLRRAAGGETFGDPSLIDNELARVRPKPAAAPKPTAVLPYVDPGKLYGIGRTGGAGR